MDLAHVGIGLTIMEWAKSQERSCLMAVGITQNFGYHVELWAFDLFHGYLQSESFNQDWLKVSKIYFFEGKVALLFHSLLPTVYDSLFKLS